MDRDTELKWWRKKDRADLDAALERVPAGFAEQAVRRALELFDLANAAMGGAKRVAPLRAPSRITSTVEWMENLRQGLSQETFFERRVLDLRPDLLPDHARITTQEWWPEIRAGVARVASWKNVTPELVAQAALTDQDG